MIRIYIVSMVCDLTFDRATPSCRVYSDLLLYLSGLVTKINHAYGLHYQHLDQDEHLKTQQTPGELGNTKDQWQGPILTI